MTMTFSRLMLAAALLLAAAGPLLAAPPANDDFAGRLTLTTSIASTVSNVDATMEVEGAEPLEPFPAGYDAGSYEGTVWWEWKPAADSWAVISTEGSAIDTVLSIWTGDGYSGPLAQVHVNDEAPPIDSNPPPAGVSRIRFFASESVDFYKIAVASRTTARGSITITANTGAQPFSLVTGAAFPPNAENVPANPVNVAAAATLIMDVRLQSSAELATSGGLLTLYSPANTVLATAPVGPANRSLINGGSGNVANGVYRMLLSIPQGSPTGVCRWGIKVVRASSGVVSTYGWEGQTPLPAGVPASVTLINDPYAAWASQHTLSGGDAAKGADPDGDGLKNLAEYECGLDPNDPALRPLIVSGGVIVQTGLPDITVVGTGDQQRLRIVYLRRIADTSVTLTARFSDDLINWADATQAASVIANDGVFTALAVEDEIVVPAKTRRSALVRMESP